MQTTSAGQTVARDGPQASNDLYPPQLAQQERELIEARRLALEIAGTTPEVGVAISGGGIRSATFAVGLFQSLARHDLLKRIDYLSTVSGGGYFGGFFGRLFLSAGKACGPASAAQQTRAALMDSQSAPLQWLRENGRYIAPNGKDDYYAAAAVYLRNWFAVQYVVGITLLSIFLLTNTLRAWAWSTAWGTHIEGLFADALLPRLWASPWLILPLLVAAIGLVPMGAAYWLTQKQQEFGRKAADRLTHPNYPLLALLLLMAVAAALFLAPDGEALAWTPRGQTVRLVYAYVVVAGVLALLFYFVSRPRAVQRARNRLSRWLGWTLLNFLIMLFFALVDSFAQTLYAISTSKTGAVLWAGTLSVTLVFLAHEFAGYLSRDQSKARKVIRIPAQLIGLALGVLLGLVVATFWATVAHAVLWQGETPHGNPGAKLVGHYTPPAPQLSLSVENHIVVAPREEQAAADSESAPATTLVSCTFLFALLISLLTGRTLTFVNLSSIQQFYAARLTRAYLGAGNWYRTRFGVLPNDERAKAHGSKPSEPALDVTEVILGDDIAFAEYRPERYGGPIHLINVTINETVSGTSQLEQRDRKGLGMAVGPCGLSVARVHHALWAAPSSQTTQTIYPIAPGKGQFAVFEYKPVQVESLTVGQWVSISGAAFTTGLGARTNLGLSLLLGFSNVRIGYWWDSGIKPQTRYKTKPAAERKSKPTDWLEPFFSAQLYLSDEFLARFHGPHRQRWYLSDGGHYENTAAYELIRRRVPFIIVSDNGCDQNYVYDDLANLIRKARIDLNAEIRFLTGPELNALLGPDLRELIGTPAELQRRIESTPHAAAESRFEGKAYSNCHALLAQIHYDGNAEAGSLMLVVKPSLTGAEPLDLIEYHAQHPTFPQEATLDQFFDEAQWESYRKLGSYIGDRLFSALASEGKWAPRSMRTP